MRLLPRDTLKLCFEVVLCMDVIFVKAISFLVWTRRALKFKTTEAMLYYRAQTRLNSIIMNHGAYTRRSFLMDRDTANNGFAPLGRGFSEVIEA